MNEPANCPVAARADDAFHAALARSTASLSVVAPVQALNDWWLHLSLSPGRSAELAGQAWAGGAQAWRAAALDAAEAAGLPGGADLLAGQDAARDSAAARGGRRFADPAWRAWPYSGWRRGFEAAETWWMSATSGVWGVERHHQDLVRFWARQWLDMACPANHPLTNPEVLQLTAREHGQNLVRGATQWWQDLRVAMDPQAAEPPAGFEVGRDLALTPGEVVMRNELIELIQYAPQTPQVHARPVLFVPAWIMKFHILDLAPGQSLVEHLVRQGLTVFMISWRNPDEAQRDLGMDDYLRLGVMAALAEVGRRVPGQPVQGVGYCLGGTLLAIAAARLAAGQQRSRQAGRGPARAMAGAQAARQAARQANRQSNRQAPGQDAGQDVDQDAGQDALPGLPALASLTLFAAQTDFSEPGELGLFIDESQLSLLEAQMREKGYLRADQMAGAFQMLRPYDLLWSRLVQSYLKGQAPQPSALMAWNADATRMPARMHGEYLRQLFLRNDLAEGRYRALGEVVALSDLTLPIYIVGTETDHVAPWRSVFKLHHLCPAEIRFVLTSGGHNAGIVNPPGVGHRHFRAATAAPGEAYVAPDDWLAQAPLSEGSWWPDWTRWLQAHAGGQCRAHPSSTADGQASLGPAPGTYVMQR